MKKLILILAFLFSINQAYALVNYAEVYPPIMQSLEGSVPFNGDRHGEFWGNPVAILSDGSAWKVHPQSMETFKTWQAGDIIHVGVRTDWYWFKREHKFLMYNHTRGTTAKVMLVQHKTQPTTIVSTETYYKSKEPHYIYRTVKKTDPNTGVTTYHTEEIFAGYKDSNPRKILFLSDGSIWVIKANFNSFQLGMNVFVGAQGVPNKFYDFVMITGTEREAQWTMGRPQIR